MSAGKTGQCWIVWGCGCALIAMAGCEPPKVPTAGGLISRKQSAEQASPTGAAPSTVEPGDANSSPPPVQQPYGSPPSAPPATDFTAQSPPQAAATASGTPIVPNPGLIPADQASSRGAKATGNDAAPGQSAKSSAAAPAVPPIQLSAGIALPQSLPTGTTMGMSVDYTIRGGLNRSSRYVWVISSQAGDIEAEVKLATSGTLANFVPKLRPEDRPFNSRIDEITPGGKRIRASNVAPMQTSY